MYGPSWQDAPPEETPTARRHRQLTVFLTLTSIAIALGGLVFAYLSYVHPPDDVSSERERAPYINAVDPLCFTAGQSLRAIGSPPLNDLGLYARNIEQARQIYGRLLTVWAQYRPPKIDQARLNDVLNDLKSMVSDMGEVARMAQAAETGGDPLLNTQIDKVRATSTSLRKATMNYGFRMCPQLFGT